MHHKFKKNRHSRAGCHMCKPWKGGYATRGSRSDGYAPANNVGWQGMGDTRRRLSADQQITEYREAMNRARAWNAGTQADELDWYDLVTA